MFVRWRRYVALLGVLVWCGWGASCSPAQTCVDGISNLSLNSADSPCTSDCDCSNQRYEGVCVGKVCIARKRDACSTPGNTAPCQMQPGPKAGLCREGTKVCKDTGLEELYWGDCKVQIVPEEGELCTNGKDDDCDGKVDDGDEACEQDCQVGEIGDCGGVGVCKGQKACIAGGVWGECQQTVGPSPETCNGLDDDCDGKADTGADGQSLTKDCYGGQSGCKAREGGGFDCVAPCKGGKQTCVGGKWSACEGAVEPKAEDCNGLDDDCDGAVDEGSNGNALQRSCFSGTGGCVKGTDGTFKCTAPCKAGAQVCGEGNWGLCEGEVGPKAEECDALDNDCDGAVDVGCSGVLSLGGTTKAPQEKSEFEKSLGLAVDAQNNVYVTGEFVSSQSFGGHALVSKGGRDTFLLKLNKKQEVEWALQASSGGDVSGRALGLAGTTLGWLGTFGGSVSVGGQGAQSTLGVSDVFVAQVDVLGKGSVKWSKGFGSSKEDEADGLAVGQGGSLYLAGVYRDALRAGNETLQSSGSSSSFVVKLDSKGQVLWASRVVSTGATNSTARIHEICANKVGDVYIVGRYERGEVSFETATGVLKSRLASGTADGFVAKVDASTGKFLWMQEVRGSDNEVTEGCAVDDSGDVVITGYLRSSVQFGSTTLSRKGGYTGYVAKLDKAGAFVWVKGLGSTGRVLGMKVALDGSGNAYAVGAFSGVADFGTKGQDSRGGYDAYVVKLDSSGKVVWSRVGGGPGADVAVAVVVAPNGEAIVGGYHSDGAVFSGVTLPVVQTELRTLIWRLAP